MPCKTILEDCPFELTQPEITFDLQSFFPFPEVPADQHKQYFMLLQHNEMPHTCTFSDKAPT